MNSEFLPDIRRWFRRKRDEAKQREYTRWLSEQYREMILSHKTFYNQNSPEYQAAIRSLVICEYGDTLKPELYDRLVSCNLTDPDIKMYVIHENWGGVIVAKSKTGEEMEIAKLDSQDESSFCNAQFKQYMENLVIGFDQSPDG